MMKEAETKETERAIIPEMADKSVLMEILHALILEIFKNTEEGSSAEDNALLNAIPDETKINSVSLELSVESSCGLDSFSEFFIRLARILLLSTSLKLEGLLPRLISQNQPGFVKYRNITENVLLAQEIITDIRSWTYCVDVDCSPQTIGLVRESKHRNDPHTMKKLWENHAKKDKKKEVHVSKQRGSNSFGAKFLAKRRRVVEVISRDNLLKCSYSSMVPIMEELEQLNLPLMSFASYHASVSSMPSSTGPTNANSPQKDSDKPIEMEGARVNQAPSPIKYSEYDEMDGGIEKMDDIVVEEMEPLDTIISVSVNDMTLTVYKPPPKILDEYFISDTHRYYGKSRPFGTMEEALKDEDTRGYFNSAQAIVDYAELLLHIKEKYSAQKSPIIVIEGSCGGSKKKISSYEFPF
ncbi:hypothetical protein BC332_28720 [Capsicum chinense]|nr:hypothetical protein BC332_28720 [Capsicum chinense]